MAQSGASSGRDGSRGPVIARAHHGSVSKEQRAQIEDDLKTGRLPCVVATSSLELGIDGCRRRRGAGRGSTVGGERTAAGRPSGPSRGRDISRVFFPNHREDLIASAVVVERMRHGAIEEVAELRNPLDVLAQQIVAIVSIEDAKAEELYALVRRQAASASCHSAFEAVLDMLSGRYPSEEFAELRPRLIWHRDTGVLVARPGAQRLAVTSVARFPTAGSSGCSWSVRECVGATCTQRRVGELDEEMVYETRVGDVFTLGTTSWRVEQITHDQVLVSPARALQDDCRFGRAMHQVGRWSWGARSARSSVRWVRCARRLRARLREAGLDEFAANNLVSYLAEQQAATGAADRPDRGLRAVP